MKRRRAALAGAALLIVLLSLIVVLLLATCEGSSSPGLSPSPNPTASPTASPSPTPTPAPPGDTQAPRDLLDLAKRFRGYPQDGPAVARTTPLNHQIGDSVDFHLVNLSNASQYGTRATVRAISEHAYFFIADDAPYNQADLDRAVADFESTVWPTVTGAFGEPWTPGVDGDPRITILHADLEGAGGYVSAEDEYPKAAVPTSNEREMLYLDQGVLFTPGTPYDALVAHELQHLVHFNGDSGEDAWVNEGLSQVAWEMAGGDMGRVPSFLAAPDTQLNTWAVEGDTNVHYAASEIFFDYLLDHYGGHGNAKSLVDESDNGVDGVDEYLAQYGVTFDDVFADFVAANLLDLPGDSPYSHVNFDGTTSAVTGASGIEGSGTVSQYGADYLHIPAGSGGIFRFQGSTEASIGIPAEDGAFWWSGRMDSMDSRLTREFDLTGKTAATLEFDTWYETEKGWDFAYVAASTDGGLTWDALPGAHTSTDDPLGASFGPGYTGDSGGWEHERIDLSGYAGKRVLIRFETVNDDSANLTGFAVDNISVPEIGFTDGADSSNGWAAEGFRRATGTEPQKYIVQVISPDGTVQRVELGLDNSAAIPLTGEVTIAISGATPDTTEPAFYSWTLQPTV